MMKGNVKGNYYKGLPWNQYSINLRLLSFLNEFPGQSYDGEDYVMSGL